MPALITPEKMANRTPFLKLNSATAFFFSSSDTSPSFDMPARPTITMPRKDIRMPISDVTPAPGVTSLPSSPLMAIGTSVPTDDRMPAPRARPSPKPRYRIIMPQVSPPKPHMTPHRKQKSSTVGSVFDRTDRTLGEVVRASAQGTTIRPTRA